MKIEDIRSKDDKALKSVLLSMEQQLLHLRFQKRMGQLQKPHLLKWARKTVARVQTVLRERCLSEAPSA